MSIYVAGDGDTWAVQLAPTSSSRGLGFGEVYASQSTDLFIS